VPHNNNNNNKQQQTTNNKQQTTNNNVHQLGIDPVKMSSHGLHDLHELVQLFITLMAQEHVHHLPREQAPAGKLGNDDGNRRRLYAPKVPY
jgi:hypothetical protein